MNDNQPDTTPPIVHYAYIFFCWVAAGGLALTIVGRIVTFASGDPQYSLISAFAWAACWVLIARLRRPNPDDPAFRATTTPVALALVLSGINLGLALSFGPLS